MESISDTRLCDLDRFCVLGSKSAIFQRGGKKIYDGKGKSLFRVGSGRLIDISIQRIKAREKRLTIMADEFLKCFNRMCGGQIRIVVLLLVGRDVAVIS